MTYTTHTACRVCGSSLELVLDLGMQKLTGWTKAPGDPFPEAPLTLMQCSAPDCTLVQLRDTADADLLWKGEYGYRSGINNTMIDALQDVAMGAVDRVDLDEGDTWLDIGCNDGTLLNEAWSFNMQPLDYIGFDPSDVARRAYAEPDQPIYELENDFFTAARWAEKGYNKAKVITAIAMFYDLNEPKQFVADVEAALAPGGIFVVQLSYLPLMLMQNDFLNICHEHIEYYSLKSLTRLLEPAGLKIFDAELNGINGGSIRVYIDRGEHSRTGMLYAYEQWEDHLLGDGEALYDFAQRAEDIRDDIIRTVGFANANGKTVWAYTASTKGNVLLQYCGFGPQDIKGASERNPAKFGRYCAGSDIPVYSEDEAKKFPIDYFLVLAWAFMPEFRRREAPWVEAGGKFIIPLPEVRIE